MAFAPMGNTSSKRSLFSAPRPNYKDFSSPPNGDYVRYVDDLMAWAAQEQERQRLKTVGDNARRADSQWGRNTAKSTSVVNQLMAQPGSVDSAVERFKRKAQAQAVKLQQQAQKKSPVTQTKTEKKPSSKIKGLSLLAVFAGFVLTSIVAPNLTPFVIIAWMVYSVINAVRSASRAGKS